MEETSDPTRRSIGLYHQEQASAESLGSQAGLASHVRPPAGSRFSENEIVRTTAAGVSGEPREGAISEGAADLDARATAAAPAAPQSHVPFYKRRKFIISQAILIPLGIVLLFVLLFPVVTAIVQDVLNNSVLGISVATISNPANSSFQLALQGSVSHTGIISAKIHFTQPVTVQWVQPNGSQLTIGNMDLDDISASHKRATVDQNTTFHITDQSVFGQFAAQMITANNFTWRLLSNNLHVQAAKFPVSKGIKFDKTLTLNGFDSFNGNVNLTNLLLPSDDPAGGINFEATTTLNNPRPVDFYLLSSMRHLFSFYFCSPFSLNLGTVVFDLSYKDVYLGTGSGSNTTGAAKNDITLSGTLVPQSGDNNLTVVSELFTNYLNGDSSDVIATGKSTLQTDGTAISWLSQGLEALQLHVPFVSLSGAISPIKSIDIGDLALGFAEETPWAPSAQSQTVQASLQLPFGFSVAISEIQNSFNLTNGDQVIAGLSTPENASMSSIEVVNSTFTSGTINITIDHTNLSVPDPEHPHFSEFNANITSLSSVDFQLVGQSRAIANLSIGQITLDPIKFNVPSSLNGLRGLNGLTAIHAVDVVGGTTEGITLNINVSIVNPSNLNLSTGDLTMQLTRDGALLGTALLPNLNLTMGNNSILAQSTFDSNNNPQAQETLDQFVGRQDVQLSIAGFNSSTAIASLTQAFETLEIGLTLPALTTNLLNTASLKVLSTTGLTNNISDVTVSLANPFTAALDVTGIQSIVSAFGITLGTIQTSTNFSSAGKSNTTSPTLPLNMNLDPSALFTVTRALAVDAGEDVAPLDGIVSLGGYEYLMTTGPAVSTESDASLYKNFALPEFVQTAFKQLKSDVNLTVDVTIGEYNAVLNYFQSSLPTETDGSLDFILPILAKPIVQKIVGGAGLGIDAVLISDPEQSSFNTALNGSINNAGPFDATIVFSQGLTVEWSGKILGTLQMDNITVVGGQGAQLNANSVFQVVDVDALTDFTKTLLTEESFEWVISGDNLTVTALGIEVTGISLTSKSVTLKGFNGLKGGVQIQSFDLPANDPAGGIQLTLNASATNPSQVGIELSSLGFSSYIDGQLIAPVSSSGAVTLNPESTSNLALVGRLIPQTSSEGLAAVSQVFNNFIHGLDSELMVNGASAGPSDVSWLNEAISALQVETSLPNLGVLNIIQSIDLNELDLQFSEDTAYAPATSSNSTTAAFTIPFDFPIDIVALQQDINVAAEGQVFAQLFIPKGPSQTDVNARIISLAFGDVPFTVVDGADSVFNEFLAATTVGTSVTMGLSGSASADASTAVGTLSLTNISFSVDTTIAGLQGLDTEPVTVNHLDVFHGFPDYLLIKVSSPLTNPSNLTIGAGDVSFGLEFAEEAIGLAVLDNLVIVPGTTIYSIDVQYSPQGDAVPAGETLLENYLQGVNSDTSIVGSTSSTPIQSLQEAMSKISLSPVTIPALNQSLISSASLTFPTDIVSTGIAEATFSLANPFTASINLLTVDASATYQNITLGTISVGETSNPIHADGHSNITSPSLPFNFNLNPVSIVELLQAGAQANGVNLGPLIDIFEFIIDNPNFNPPVNPTVDTSSPTCVSGNQFDFDTAILDSLKNLKIDLAVQSSVKLDDYATNLTFAQHDVDAITDSTALYLIGAVAGPVAQQFVDNAELSFNQANISDISDEGFSLTLKGSLTNTGPLDASITFTEPLEVTWEGRQIATISLPPSMGCAVSSLLRLTDFPRSQVCAAANVGVPDYETDATLSITDLDQFTTFATFLLHNPSFSWTISSSKVQLVALGTIFDNVSLTKNVSFNAFNGLPGVTISNFQLPSDSSEGGITIDLDAQIPSPAQLGLDLGTVTFDSFYDNVLVGPLVGEDLVLSADATTTTHLSGRIIPQSGSDLNTIGQLFSDYLAGDNLTLVAKGVSVQPPGSSSTVSWLSTAFATLALDVILPGEKLDVIQSITVTDLAVTLNDDSEAYDPSTGSNFTSASYKNPFGFSLQVVQSATDIILSSNGVNIAELSLPTSDTVGGVSTGNVANLPIAWENEPLKSLNDDAFNALFAAVTLSNSISLGLDGSANVTAKTTIGDVPISRIPFNVTSSLSGINSFGGRATLSNVTVTGSGGTGGNEFINAPLTTTLENPSNISLDTTDIALPVYYEGSMVGRAFINNLNLVPGTNSVPSEFHYEPANSNDSVAQSFIADFLTSNNSLPLSIKGDSASTPIDSLQEALSGLSLRMGQTLIKDITVTITLDSLVTNEVTVNVDIFNPTDAELQVLAIQSTGSIDGTVYAQFSTTFDSYLIPAGQTVNSGEINNVLLTQGAIASLGIIGENLDVAAANTIQVGVGGYTLPWLKINQLDVPTTYTLDIAGLTLGQLKSQAEQNASSISSSAVGSKPTSASTSQNGSTSVSATVSLSSLASSTITSSTTGDGTTAEATSSASSAGKEDSSTATSATANTPLMPASSASSDAAPTSATLVATLLV
ncbi:uncharacterized protein C8R40DRAFT_1170817 [Lentinula edodes]|uniref:uncharacterized protein n=1 Tax=Lentinula edodes TaxID=5353 RepID=UPI001E8DA40C|nr:uncharacterized protein C8R40DRAFT_1170817 [Lentinula edodes]KAH7875192.1 hypothetical protein C8R40DRAFT_1170817 [Lentinula edodes]